MVLCVIPGGSGNIYHSLNILSFLVYVAFAYFKFLSWLLFGGLLTLSTRRSFPRNYLVETGSSVTENFIRLLQKDMCRHIRFGLILFVYILIYKIFLLHRHLIFSIFFSSFLLQQILQGNSAKTESSDVRCSHHLYDLRQLYAFLQHCMEDVTIMEGSIMYFHN